jgi:energy-coupling factor transporter ATP-binding protein EcfA2
MATYFLNCSENIENFNLCISHNIAGFPNGGYKTGDLIYLIVKENGKWKLGARGKLLEATTDKPWPDADSYPSAFKVNWELCNKTDITEGLRKIYEPNFGLAIQGKKDIDTFQGKGNELKGFFNQFFTNSSKVNNATKLNMKDLINHAHKYITNLGFQYQFEEIANFYLALRAKPFVILAGISGTGKTKLPRKFAEALGFNEEEQLIQIPVRPDWTDSSDLLGYTSLDKTFIPKALTLAIKKAIANPEKPYFFILDEMNLARVEHYFSDYLSVIETRKREVNSKTITTDKILRDEILNGATNASDFKNIGLPQNLYLIGTVNMDETTHAFSRKVLDRANSIEMNEVDLNWISSNGNPVQKLTDISNSLFETSYISSAELTEADKESIKEEMQLLQSVNKILQKADLQFAYRVRDEIAFYLTINSKNNLIEGRLAFDFQLVQKILPRIHGSSERVQRVLIELIYLIEKGETENVRTDVEFQVIEKQFPIDTLKYKRASKKILFMLKRFDEDRFTSFWL